MADHVYTKTCRTPVTVDTLFSWHERPGALERLTPPWMVLRNIRKKGGIETGARIAMEMGPAASPIPLFIPMMAEHVGYEKNRFFMDMMLKGPFSKWEHCHTFSSLPGGGATLQDRIHYALPFHLPKSWRPMVEKELDRLFNYRHRVMGEDLARHNAFYTRYKDRFPLRNEHGITDPFSPSPFMERGSGGEVNGQVVQGQFLPSNPFNTNIGANQSHCVNRSSHRVAAYSKPLTILISGASGPVGKALIPFLTTGGHRVIQLVRRPPQNRDEIPWDPYKGVLDLHDILPLHDTLPLHGIHPLHDDIHPLPKNHLKRHPMSSWDGDTIQKPQETAQKIDVVINLNGYHIGSGRWTKKTREIIVESRNRSTSLLSKKILALPKNQRPELFISASATGFYGECGEGCVDENSCCGDLFISQVCDDWEACAKGVADAGIRTVFARMGVVLTPTGGALERLLPPFLMGLGAKIGSGTQFMSWISMDDLIYALYHIMGDPDITGAVNLVSPNPVTNAEFTQTLGRLLSRPARFRIPAELIRLVWGKMGEEVLLASTRVLPDQLTASHFRFSYPTLEGTLQHLLGC